MRRFTAAAATAAIIGGSLLAATAPASADGGYSAEARKYSNCTQLQRDFRNGVARNRQAAQRQVNQGNSRPAFGPRARAVYRKNNGPLDRDNDGTACER